MQSIIRGFVTQSVKMDPLEKLRRWKRSLDGYMSFRKAVLIALCVFAALLYVGPSVFSWLFFSSSRSVDIFDVSQSCINDKLGRVYVDDLRRLDGHIRHLPWRSVSDTEDLLYVGNGHFGLTNDVDAGLWSDARFHVRAGAQRTLKTPVKFKPVVRVSVDEDFSPVGKRESASVLSYTNGLLHGVDCYLTGGGGGREDFSVEHRTYAHRAVREVLVQEFKLSNPTSKDKLFNVERIGVSGWDGVQTRDRRIGDGGGQRYTVATGTVKISQPFSDFSDRRSPFEDDDDAAAATARKDRKFAVVTVVAPVLEKTLVVGSRSAHDLLVVTAISHSEALTANEARDPNRRHKVEERAVDAIVRSLAVSSSSNTLLLEHRNAWHGLWTTGFGISHSMAENAVNGRQINATLYYVLSQSPTPLHSLQTSPKKKAELEGHLAYSEGCYGSLPTLHETKNLWRPLKTLHDVNRVVQYWFLNLEVNGCHKLLRAGAEGVVQAMVLSFAGLKFRQHHLELDANPKDLHRDYQMRRVRYGNATRLNISVTVQDDNKAVIDVALDRKNGDYFACDAGCLDPPVKLSSSASSRFPVKLTDPVTAVLYVTSDYDHMMELKHTIHVKEVVDAPAHENHVLALHKHGNKLGGLPVVFWLSIGFLIFVFHVFLFKLIWQEYCSGGGGGGSDKFRTRKFSDYH